MQILLTGARRALTLSNGTSEKRPREQLRPQVAIRPTLPGRGFRFVVAALRYDGHL